MSPGPAPDVDDDAAGTDVDADDDAASAPRRRPLLDARTIMVCALVALVAAVLAGLVVSRLTGDEEQGPTGELVAAESVPDIPLARLGGEGQASLADYRGQPLVVNFWGSWCGPCVEEMPDLQRVHASLGDDVAFVGVNVRDREDKALELVEETGVTYDLLTDTGGTLSRALEVASFPTTLLVLPDGTIAEAIYLPVSAERLCEKIDQTMFAGGLGSCG